MIIDSARVEDREHGRKGKSRASRLLFRYQKIVSRRGVAALKCPANFESDQREVRALLTPGDRWEAMTFEITISSPSGEKQMTY